MNLAGILSTFGAGLAAAAVRLAGAFREHGAERRAETERLLAEAEDILLFGAPPNAKHRLDQVARRISPSTGGATGLAWARLHLARGGVARAEGRLADARGCFEAALSQLSSAGDDDRVYALRALAHCHLALLGFAVSDEELLREHEKPAFELESAVRDPRSRVPFVWLALRVGEVEHVRGRWDDARERFERAVAIGETIPLPNAAQFGPARDKELAVWAEGRASASAAALAIGAVLSSVGERETADEWFARAERMVEGADHPTARVARARVLLERARSRPVDLLGDPTPRREGLAAAVREGIESSLPAGRLVAGEAEIELGMQCTALGDPGQASAHYELADERVKELDDEDAVVLGLRGLLLAGRAHQSRGVDGRPTELLRAAMERGRTHVHPEARRLAAVAAQGLHECLLDEGHLAEARHVLDILERMIPGLPAANRPILSAGLGYRRGQQWLHEREWEKAARILETTEARALTLTDPEAANLARAAATARGIAAFESGALEEAKEHFMRALGQPGGPAVPQEVLVERAWAAVRLGQALLRLGEESDAMHRLQAAQREGMQSGHNAGRCAAAMAAFLEAELPWQSIEIRERLYETAARLGRLSGIARGRDLAEAAEARLRELES